MRIQTVMAVSRSISKRRAVHLLQWISVSPRLLVAHVVDDHQDEDGRDERTRATNGHVEHLAAGRGAGSGDQYLLGPGVTLVLQANFLPPEFQIGAVPPRQRDVYT